MYKGVKCRARISRSSERAETRIAFSEEKNRGKTCLTGAPETTTDTGEKLNGSTGEAGSERAVQFKAQHRRARLASFVCSLLFAFRQQSVTGWFMPPECRGVPASAPAVRARRRKAEVSHFLISCFTVLNEPVSLLSNKPARRFPLNQPFFKKRLLIAGWNVCKSATAAKTKTKTKRAVKINFLSVLFIINFLRGLFIFGVNF